MKPTQLDRIEAMLRRLLWTVGVVDVEDWLDEEFELRDFRRSRNALIRTGMVRNDPPSPPAPPITVQPSVPDPDRPRS